MRIGVGIALISLAIVSLPVSAYSDPAQPSDPPPAAASDSDQIVCRAMPPATGTRLGGGRECHTQRDWDARQRAAQKALMDDQTRGLQGGTPNSGG